MERNRQMLGMVVLLLLWCTLHGNGEARVMVEMQTATGTITNIRDNIITLKGGSLFYPGVTYVSPPLNTGMIVTIRYYKAPDGTHIYKEVALGKNTLSPTPPRGDDNFKDKDFK